MRYLFCLILFVIALGSFAQEDPNHPKMDPGFTITEPFSKSMSFTYVSQELSNEWCVNTSNIYDIKLYYEGEYKICEVIRQDMYDYYHYAYKFFGEKLESVEVRVYSKATHTTNSYAIDQYQKYLKYLKSRFGEPEEEKQINDLQQKPVTFVHFWHKQSIQYEYRYTKKEIAIIAEYL